MLELKLIHVSKRGHSKHFPDVTEQSYYFEK